METAETFKEFVNSTLESLALRDFPLPYEADILGCICASYIKMIENAKTRELSLVVKGRIERLINQWEKIRLPYKEEKELVIVEIERKKK